MSSFVGFLRAINLGRNRRVPMTELRDCLAAAGFAEVETHLQTGNVRLATSLRSAARVEAVVERALLEEFGFDVPTIVLTPSQLREVYDDAASTPPPLPGELRRYVTFLKQPAAPDTAAPIDAWDADGERAVVRGRAVHWWLSSTFHTARLSNARIERHLGPATTRDLKVVTTLAERWGS